MKDNGCWKVNDSNDDDDDDDYRDVNRDKCLLRDVYDRDDDDVIDLWMIMIECIVNKSNNAE